MSRCIHPHSNPPRQQYAASNNQGKRGIIIPQSRNVPSEAIQLPSTPKEKDGLSPDKGRFIETVPTGDTQLHLRLAHRGLDIRYRVCSGALSRVSAYFQTLLYDGKFAESIHFQQERRRLLEAHGDLKHVCADLLPTVHITDLGSVPKGVLLDLPFAVVLRILHGTHDQNQFLSTEQLATIAIIADRFELTEYLGNVFRRGSFSCKRAFSRSLTMSASSSSARLEETLRQILLIATIFRLPDPLTQLSSRLVMNGSKNWSVYDPDLSDDSAMWWDLPHNLEEELSTRRNRILATLASLQQHFIALYSNPKTLQCTLGYDTSPACDSFQFGEMIRFFSRCGTLNLSSTFYHPQHDDNSDLETPATYKGNLMTLYDILKACPSRQIDNNHKHCGLRTRFIPALEHIFHKLAEKIEVCGVCWVEGRRSREEISWRRNPAGGEWRFDEDVRGEKGVVEGMYERSWRMFTAERWDWTPRRGDGVVMKGFKRA